MNNNGTLYIVSGLALYYSYSLFLVIIARKEKKLVRQEKLPILFGSLEN